MPSLYTSAELEELLTNNYLSGQYAQLAKEICHSVATLDIVLQLNEHTNSRIAWRSAYLFDLAHDANPALFINYLPRLIAALPTLKNHSIKRHYTRILSTYNLCDIATGETIDCCLNWLMTEEIPIAVKANCMQILYNLCTEFPELAHELKIVLNEILPTASKGVGGKAKKILAELAKVML